MMEISVLPPNGAGCRPRCTVCGYLMPYVVVFTDEADRREVFEVYDGDRFKICAMCLQIATEKLTEYIEGTLR